MSVWYMGDLIKDELIIFHNRLRCSPIVIHLDFYSLDKDEYGKSINEMYITTDYLWMRDIPRIGEFIKFSNILEQQTDCYFSDEMSHQISL